MVILLFSVASSLATALLLRVSPLRPGYFLTPDPAILWTSPPAPLVV